MKEINKIYIYFISIKILLINYLSLFLSFNILLNYDDIEIFVLILINVYLFNFITFWFQGILFNFIYGDKCIFIEENIIF